MGHFLSHRWDLDQRPTAVAIYSACPLVCYLLPDKDLYLLAGLLGTLLYDHPWVWEVLEWA